MINNIDILLFIKGKELYPKLSGLWAALFL